MWFINDFTVKEIEPSEDKVLKICSENNIKVGTAWSKSKFLGRVISNEDYHKLIRALKKNRKH